MMCFPWSYEEMSGIDPQIFQHEIELMRMLNRFDKSCDQ
jgi:hypothetical protein